MIEMFKPNVREKHVNVDLWDTPENPISEEDRIFKNVKGEIILPISTFFGAGESQRQLDYFAMSVKRSYNSDETREHICRYMNYFEKYYDTEKELLMIIYEMKVIIDYNSQYTKQMFMDDINRYIIRNKKLSYHVKQFVEDNYLMNLSSNTRTPNLQFEDKHAKILYEMSLIANMYIPLATHYMYIHFIKQSEDVHNFMLELFDMVNDKYETEEGISIYSKLYEIAISVVNKSKNADKVLWDKNMIRGINTTTHTQASVLDIILQIMPKYKYYDVKKQEVSNIISFNYYSNRQCLKFGITDVAYEYQFTKLSSSKRDQDNNSEFDRFEARINKKDEAIFLQNKCQAEQTIRKIELLYGPFEQDEIDYYLYRLTQDGKAVINSFQKQMVGYLFFKELGDPISLKSINQIDYIKLIIAGKRLLKNAGLVILPYVISSRVERVATRKTLNKKEHLKLEKSELHQQIQAKYKNPKIEQHIWELIGKVISSKFVIIDYDTVNHCPSKIDNEEVPIISDILDQEIQIFITMI